ncbi:MAG: 23S rRNA (guanosine(2251)-2'-O)-methyltransferase RlmB [Candidatus Omnitrophica bacterium]|nr:23S rRNA (guanosine(2251)-2'-O)-methyltransferase RlmB [Candidatus Omnitrophota bacterium]
MYLYGKNSVSERLKKNPQTIHAVYMEDKFADDDIEKLIKLNNITAKKLPQDKLTKIKFSSNLQGILAQVDNFKYSDFDELLTEGLAKNETIIFLDRVYDPQNLGAIMRNSACFGGFSLVIPKHKACEVTETVLHVACGAENYVKTAMVSNISNAVIKAKKEGFWIMGAMLDADAKELNTISIPFPLGVVFGSEGEGVRYGVGKQIDIKAKIPMHGAELSYNVSAASAIFCYEINRQKK